MLLGDDGKVWRDWLGLNCECMALRYLERILMMRFNFSEKGEADRFSLGRRVATSASLSYLVMSPAAKTEKLLRTSQAFFRDCSAVI